MMSQKCISLHNSCRNRFSSQISPSFANRTYTIEEFSSRDFLDTVLFPKYEKNRVENTNFDAIFLKKLIDRTDETFKRIQGQIDLLHSHFVQQLTSYCIDNSKVQELATLKISITKCHQNVLASNLDPRLIDDLVSLLTKYEQAHDKSETLTTMDKTSTTMKRLDEITVKLYEATKQCEDRANWKTWRTSSSVNSTSSMDGETRVYEKVELLKLERNENPDSKGAIIKQRDGACFLFANRDLRSRPNFFRMADLRSGKLLFSTSNTENLSGNIQKLFSHIEDLNLTVANHTNLALTFYRATAKGMRKITNIPIVSSKQGLDTDFEFLDPQYILAVSSRTSSSLTFLNLFTRKIIQGYSYDEEVSGIKYIRGLKLFVVALNTKLLVYDVSRQMVLNTLKYSVPLNIEEYYRTITVSSNFILIQTHRYDRPRSGQDNSRINLHLFQINYGGAKEYKAEVRTLDLYNARNGDGSIPEVKVKHVVIKPSIRMMKMFYTVDGSKKTETTEVEFGDENEPAGGIEGDVLPEEELVYFKNNKLLVERKKVD